MKYRLLGKSGLRVSEASLGTSNPDHWSAEGISTPGQSRQLDLELSAEQLKSLDGAGRIEPGFPHSIYDREMVRAIRHGGMWDRLLL